MMRIALIARGCRPGAGIERYTYELARRLAQHHSVDVITDPREYAECGARLVPVRVSRWPLWQSILRFSLCAGRLARQGHYDVVHTQGSDADWGDVVTVHSCHWAGMRASIKVDPRCLNRWRKAVNPAHRAILAMERSAFTHARELVAVSSRVSRQVRGVYTCLRRRSISVIHPGVDSTPYALPSQAGAALRAKMGIDSRQVVFTLLANSPRLKGGARLIQSLAFAQARNLVVVVASGEGKSFGLDQLARRLGVGASVRFVAVHQDPAPLYAASDVIVDLPEYESFGLTVLEAMASSRPLMVTRNVGAAELLTPDREGVVLPSWAPPRIVAQAMDRLASDAPGRQRMGERARCTAQNHSWDRMQTALEDIYIRVGKEHPTR